jgi:hypothetical protein
MIYKISPDPSLLKRGIKLVPDIFIILPLEKGEFIFPPLEKRLLSSALWKRGAYFPPFFHHTIHYRASSGSLG